MTFANQASDVVIRFHDLSRLNELERAVFSVAAQTVRPVTAHVVTQRLGDDGVAAVEARLRPLFHDIEQARLEVHDWRAEQPRDGRSCLINEGVRNARGRYLSFLDYDDVLFPEAHALLTERLRASGAAIAFGGVQMMDVAVFDAFIMTTGKRTVPLGGWTLRDLFHKNRAPIHSYVIDRQRIATEAIWFDQTLTWEEDYDFLLRICARYKADLDAIDKPIGYYNFKADGSNSVPTTASAHRARADAYERVREEMDRRKRLIEVAPEVLADLGTVAGRRSGGRPTTVADLIDGSDAR